MAKVEGPLFSLWAQGSVGRGTMYFKPRHIASNTFVFSVSMCKGKLTRYAKNKIYGFGGKGERVAEYWKLWKIKYKQFELLKYCDDLYYIE